MSDFWKRVHEKKKNVDIQRATGKNSSTVSTWVKNGTIPSAALCQKIAEECDVTIEYLVTGNEEPEIFRIYKEDPKFALFLDVLARLDRADRFQIVGAARYLFPEKFADEGENKT